MKRTEKTIIAMAEECLKLGKMPRPEIQWLNQVYDRFRQTNGSLGKSEADELIYMKMYAAVPEKSSDTLKIRYWRTGRHLPAGRDQCLAFGRALELSEKEMSYMIQGYYDRSDCVFEGESKDTLYLERKKYMNQLIQEYLDKVHPVIRLQLYRCGADIEHSLRHLYYTDAKGYLECRALEETEVEPHIASINYESEFSRQMKLQGEIPRKTMLRHLLLLGIPFINRDMLSQRLEYLGYHPLDEKHSQVDGSRLDKLVLNFLSLYETSCAGRDPEICVRWFHQAYSILESYLEKMQNSSLRFLYFKALKGMK